MNEQHGKGNKKNTTPNEKNGLLNNNKPLNTLQKGARILNNSLSDNESNIVNKQNKPENQSEEENNSLENTQRNINKEYDITNVDHLKQLGAHLGTKKSKCHNSMKRFIERYENDKAIINVEQLAADIQDIGNILKERAKNGKQILIVSKKQNVAQTANMLCNSYGIANVTYRWPPGLLTNWLTISKMIFQQKKQFMNAPKGSNKKYEKIYRGLSFLKKKPEVILVYGEENDSALLPELTKIKDSGIEIIVLCSTNVNLSGLIGSARVCALDCNKITSSGLLMKYITGKINEGNTEYVKEQMYNNKKLRFR